MWQWRRRVAAMQQRAGVREKMCVRRKCCAMFFAVVQCLPQRHDASTSPVPAMKTVYVRG